MRLAELPEHERVLRKLRSAEVPRRELEAFGNLPVTTRELARGEDVVSERDRPTHSALVLSGFTCRYKILPDGQRQIMAFHIAGDVPDLQSLHLSVMDHSIGCLTATTVALLPHKPLREVIYGNPGLCHVLWRDTLVDAAIQREWMLGIGRLSAYARIAHLLCELLVKHWLAGLTDGRSFSLPVTQTELGDALGLSSVHVNRVLQALRRDGLIEFDRGSATVLDWELLRTAGAFDPTYMHVGGGVASLRGRFLGAPSN